MVLALYGFNGEIHAGGLFHHVGLTPFLSDAWAKMSETGVPWIVYQPSSVTAQPGQTVSFTTQPAGGYGPLTFQWFRFDVPLTDGPTGTGSVYSGTTTTMLTISNISHTDYGDYHMELSGPCGDATSAVAQLNLTGESGVTPAGPVATVYEAIGPNPSRGPTSLAFTLARSSRVRARVDDVAGRRVRTMEWGALPAGSHRETWDARSDDGGRVAPGLYFVTLEVDGRSLGARRVALLR
jgi:hypothetical protein